jgi:hypothetical protein
MIKIKNCLKKITKKIFAFFDGGKISTDGGSLLLTIADEQTGIIKRLAKTILDKRNTNYISHTIETLLRQRIFQIACDYEDANDCNDLRKDPMFKLACGTSDDLASQPTMSRFENSLTRKEIYNLHYALVDNFLNSYSTEPTCIVLDLDDTIDETHGAQQLSLFNTYYDTEGYLPLHIYEAQSGKLVLTLLRPCKRATGVTLRAILKRLVKHIRKQWKQTQIIIRGDSHFGVPEVYDWCDENSVIFVTGQSSNSTISQLGNGTLEKAKSLQQQNPSESVCLFTEFEYKAKNWDCSRRIIMKAEVTPKGINPRYIATNLKSSQPSFIYKAIFCQRGQMENYIKEHKNHLHSDRTSCSDYRANMLRLVIHSAAYVLMHKLRELLSTTEFSKAQFNTLQNKILKIGVRVEELKHKIVLHFSECYEHGELVLKMFKKYNLCL